MRVRPTQVKPYMSFDRGTASILRELGLGVKRGADSERGHARGDHADH